MPQRGTSWLVTDGPDAAVGQVAMRTLRGRLRAVWAEAQAAAEGTAPEHVHRLRVATRRTLAALDVFRDVLPPRRAAWFRKRLRLLRQAAGDARDLDVLTGRLRQGGSRPEPAASAARSRLVAMLSRQRTVSRGPIRELYERLTEADWHGRVDTFLERVADRGRRTRFGDYARRRFGPLTADFFAIADRRLRDADEIHRVRIEAKKLRYAVEIFAGVFPAATLARCQDALARLQETLGEFTDHATAADRFRRWSRDESMRSDRDTLAEFRRREDMLADDARRAFSDWWSRSRRRALRRTFERSLRRESA
ncbi:CHAD domain-containing protein [bacterium]|nr:CHAD domain-containing protein [bacterium]